MRFIEVLKKLRSIDPTVALALGACGFIAIILSIAILVGANKVSGEPEVFQPLQDLTPVKVNVQTVTQGGVISVSAVKCNNSKTDVVVTGLTYYRNVKTDEIVLATGGGTEVRQPGCKAAPPKDYTVPKSVVPGDWTLRGVDVTRNGTLQQQEAWWTEVFTVTASEGN